MSSQTLSALTVFPCRLYVSLVMSSKEYPKIFYDIKSGPSAGHALTAILTSVTYFFSAGIMDFRFSALVINDICLRFSCGTL